MTTILVVDDDQKLLKMMQRTLRYEGFRVLTALNGREAMDQLQAQTPDLIVLDWMMPELDGLEMTSTLRASEEDIPILMLTARSEEADIVTGLELGADDYLTKPFSPRVLLARIKAVLRRHHAKPVTENEMITRGELVLHPGRHEVLLAGASVLLTPTEFRILHLLVRRPGWVFTRNQIIDAAQGEDTSVTVRSVDVHIVSLRRKLGVHGATIETIRGVGYRFKDAEE